MRGIRCLPVLVVLGACGASPTRPALRPVNAGLETLTGEAVPSGPTPGPIESADTRTRNPWEQAALDLQTILHERQAVEDDAATVSERHEPPKSVHEVSDELSKDETATDEPVSNAHARTDATAAQTPESPEADDGHQEASTPPTALATNEPQSLGQRLRTLLLERAAQSGEPLTDSVRAAIIEGALGLPSDAELTQLHLHPSERARIDALRALAGSLTSEDLSSDTVLEEIERLSRELSASLRAFRLRDAALCTEVRGLGDYDPIEDPTFLAGKPHRIIVYSEPDRFASREMRKGGTTLYELDISQELTLYHDAPGDLQVWHQPRGRIREASRRPKRDLYLVHEIILPARLGVGSYVLKVRTRDEISGASAERSLPIRLVADPRLVRAGD